MKKQKILIIIVVFLTITLAVTALFLNKNQTINDEKKVIINQPAIVEPTIKRVIIPTRTSEVFKSNTGAQEIIMSDDEYEKSWLVNDLRNKAPIKNDYFEIDYNYKTDVFEVKNFKDKGVFFKKWLQESGYLDIPNDRIIMIN